MKFLFRVLIEGLSGKEALKEGKKAAPAFVFRVLSSVGVGLLVFLIYIIVRACEQ